ncbi:Quinone oxidoreductase 1 [Serratia grimesii]|uniref:zinc-dependent alcohol dehydrogenase family protein n=1 Tax=Serratia grimesii TaxID=82995 RepID=UPI00076F3A66|nr:zinc-dependent alcohol dehydrogenase family protein [Serratia grimesii]CUW12633.1 Quinone oxidoreductase 1 [Serratia grimesii]SMZ56274.1 Quinone oxidoreductase 1 [Serratia grimesii]
MSSAFFPRLCFSRFGIPDQVLDLEQTRIPTQKPNHLHLRMHYAPINPSDLIPIHGQYAHRTALPQVPGYEGMGVVVDSHGCPTDRRALAIMGDGSWQTFITVEKARVIWVPDDIDDASAAQIYINPLTCWVLLTQWLSLNAGDILLINAGGSAISLLFCQLAALRGIKLVVVVRNTAHRQALLNAGAWRVYETSLLQQYRLQQLTGHTARAAIDCIGGEDGLELARSVSLSGDFVALGLLSGQQVDWQYIAHQLRLRTSLFHLRKWNAQATLAMWHAAFQQLFYLVRSGQLTLQPPAAIYPLRHYKLALQHAADSKTQGKVFFTPE